MASITTRKNGSRFIRFQDADRRWRTVTLGQVPHRYAQSVKTRIEDLASAMIYQHAARDDTAIWVANLDDKLHAKLAAVGLVAPRQRTTLTEWLESYLNEREPQLKPESARKRQKTPADYRKADMLL